MNSLKHLVSTAALSLLLVALSGCTDAGSPPELGLVQGRVTLDGQPLRGVQVMFQPTEGRPAFGTTDAIGNYTLDYMPQTPGCAIGKNRVTIGNAEGDGEEAELEGDELVQTPENLPTAIPARYNEQSELEAEVKPGENTFDWELKSKP